MAQKASGHLRLCPEPRNAKKKVALSGANAPAPPEWEPIKREVGAKAPTTKSLALLRERWHAKRDGEGLKKE